MHHPWEVHSRLRPVRGGERQMHCHGVGVAVGVSVGLEVDVYVGVAVAVDVSVIVAVGVGVSVLGANPKRVTRGPIQTARS